MPHLVELDHHRSSFRLRLLGVGGRELLQPGLDGGRGDTQELGGAVHGQAADIEQHGRHLQGQRLAAWGRVGEVQAATFAQIALLVAHPPVLDMLFAPAALAPKSHGQSPWRSSSARKIGHLYNHKTLHRARVCWTMPMYCGSLSAGMRVSSFGGSGRRGMKDSWLVS